MQIYRWFLESGLVESKIGAPVLWSAPIGSLNSTRFGMGHPCYGWQLWISSDSYNFQHDECDVVGLGGAFTEPDDIIEDGLGDLV